MSADDAAKRNYARVNQMDPPMADAPMGKAGMDFVFGQVWSTPGLSWRERRLVSLVCTAISGHAFPLEFHLRGALESGDFTDDDLRAVALHVAAYAGFPVAAGMEPAIRKVSAGHA